MNIITFTAFTRDGRAHYSIDLDKLAEEVGNPAYKYQPFQHLKRQELCYSVPDFRKVAQLILKYAPYEVIDKADETWSGCANEKVRKAWSDVKARFGRS